MWSVAQDELRGWCGEGVDGRTSTQMATGNWNHWKGLLLVYSEVSLPSAKYLFVCCFFRGNPLAIGNVGSEDDRMTLKWQEDSNNEKKHVQCFEYASIPQKNRKHLVFFRNQLGITVGSPESNEIEVTIPQPMPAWKELGMAKVPCVGQGRALPN